MQHKYKVATFVPKLQGCGSQDNGWDPERCKQFQDFLNSEVEEGWRLHSCEYRDVSVKTGCGGATGAWLVCIFEKI